MFSWNWKLSDLSKVKQNGLKVFSCFACGGGSSMGYKLAGYTVLGNCEIDAKVAEVYKQNLHPRYSFVMDVREFLALPDDKMPPEFFELDVLDGSPPCSVFSTAGSLFGSFVISFSTSDTRLLIRSISVGCVATSAASSTSGVFSGCGLRF